VAIPASAANLLYSMPTMTALATGLTGSISGTAGAAVISGPTLTLSQAGTYSLSSMVTTSTAASTFSTAQTAKCWLYRTNNTPGVVANTTAAVVFPIMTTLSIPGPTVAIPPTWYSTSNSDDAIKVYCSISANPSAGEVDVTAVSMMGQRFK